MKYTDFANPFQGNSEINLPAPVFPANTWHFIKGLAGNTHPGAVLPFGKYSCLAYDGAYPTGYGVNASNSGGKIEKIYERKQMIGISHFHQSGTGAIKVYYNYALTVPFIGDFPDFSPCPILAERATPGYYSAKTGAVIAETTVSRKIACHRYRFEGMGGGLAVNFANDGLYKPQMRGKASGKVTLLGDSRVLAEMTLSGLNLWFCAECTKNRGLSLFRKDSILAGDSATLEEDDVPFGCIFKVGQTCEFRLSVSAVSAEHAISLMDGETRSFDEILADAQAVWENALSKIEIETDDAREREIFYSNLYHTLVKPADFSDECFGLDSPSGACVTDIATMWDIYKTQLPFLFTLYPDISEKFLGTFARFAKKNGYFPHCMLLSAEKGIEAKQARMLAEYSVCDAFYRGIRADYEELLALSERDAARFPEFLTGECEYASHTLDIAEAYASLAGLARALGHPEKADRFSKLGEKFKEAFDADGLMRENSKYYEGNRYNYSFRPLHDMKARIAIAGYDRTLRETERFFGFRDADDLISRFEGFNNETDMEAPYFLHYLGKRDLLCRVIRSGTDSMFTTGDGGIPGNADSGGLTACYLWNVLGLFPVTGQNKMILGTPRYRKATLHLPGNDLVIERAGKGEGITPVSVSFCGRDLPDFELPVTEMMRGGRLRFTF